MATIGASVMTIADHAKLLDPDGRISTVAELLVERNEIIKVMPMVQGNLPIGHRYRVRTGLPTVYWRLANSGVTPSKSTSAQATDQCGMLEGWSEIDKDIAEMGGNVAETRLDEAIPFFQSMDKEIAQTMVYGNSGLAPEEFTGLAVRYSSTTAASGQNILLGGGSGSDNSSIYLVCLGNQTIFSMFPLGSKAGLIHEDMGLVTVETTAGIAGNRMRAYQERWQWKCGLCVKDWRYGVRIPNIDISALVAKSSAADLIELMIKAIHRLPDMTLGKPYFFMNRTCFQMLDIQRRDDVITGGGLRVENVDGQIVYTFRGIPILINDGLLETEALVS